MVVSAWKDLNCSIARSLDVLGERWTLLVVREACFGRTRFSEFRDALGVAPDVLSDRLATLVEVGVLERRPYREDGGRRREEYVLTPAGDDLRLVLASLQTWGDQHRPARDDLGTRFVEGATGEAVTTRFVAGDGRLLEPGEVVAVRPTRTVPTAVDLPA